MTSTGHFPNGTNADMCDTAWELYYAWLAVPMPDGPDPFDNDAGRAYWNHRDECPECTKRKEKEND